MVEISIVIPVYNVEKWIDKYLQSVERQTFTNYEVIIVNDGTQDNSDKIAQRYCDKYDNWKIINTPNQGLSKARNEGLKYVNGKYIYFLDSDDYINGVRKTNPYSQISMYGFDRYNSNIEVDEHMNIMFGWSSCRFIIEKEFLIGV